MFEYQLEYIADKIDDFFVWLLPYDWRPKELWYKFRCRFWNQYSTVKPRFLPHTWVDKDHLMVHLIFETLCRFIEDEKPSETINWESDEEHSHAWKEMNELYRWWLDIYIPWENNPMPEELPPARYENMNFVYNSPEEEKRAKDLMKKWNEEEAEMERLLTENCKRILDIRGFLWT